MLEVINWFKSTGSVESILVNALESLLANIVLILLAAPWKWFRKPKQIGLNGKISVEYWRLFGGRSVPILMKLFDRTHEVVEPLKARATLLVSFGSFTANNASGFNQSASSTKSYGNEN